MEHHVIRRGIVVCALAVIGCDDGDDSTGTLGGSCYPNQTCELGLICQDGAEKTVHAIGHAITDETGKTILLLGTVQDITEQVQAQDALREREQESQAFVETSRDWI